MKTLERGDETALLAVLPELRDLRALTLVLQRGCGDSFQWANEAAAFSLRLSYFSAITASSQLEALHLTGVPLPAQVA